MMQVVRATIDVQGYIHYIEPVRVDAPRQALVILLDEGNETARLAQPALTSDWLKPEEDAAWAHLQPGKELSFPSRFLISVRKNAVLR